MKQSARAKEAWAGIISSQQKAGIPSMFNCNKYPGLLGQLKERIPEGANLIILGDGRGYLGLLLKDRVRSVLNIDLYPGNGAFVPTIKGDMEEPLLGLVGVSKNPLSVLTPFSAEYTYVPLSSRNIADLLKPGEQWIWLCHHGDSYIVQSLEAASLILVFVDTILLKLSTATSEDWERYANQASVLALTSFDLVVDSKKLPEFSAFSRKQMSGFISQLFKLNINLFFIQAMQLVSSLKLGVVNPQRAIEEVSIMQGHIAEHVIYSELLRTHKFYMPRDMVAVVDPRLSMNLDKTFELKDEKGKPVLICAVFERV